MVSRSVVAISIHQIWQRYERTIGAVAAGVAMVALGFSIQAKFWELRVPGQRAFAGESILVYPVGPVNYLKKQRFEGNLFVPFNFGAFVSWKLWPEVRVSIDSRYEVAYPPGTLEDNLKFYHAIGDWRALIESEETDGILIPRDQPIATELRALQQDRWRLVYQDQEFLLLLDRQKAAGLVDEDHRLSAHGVSSLQGDFP